MLLKLALLCQVVLSIAVLFSSAQLYCRAYHTLCCWCVTCTANATSIDFTLLHIDECSCSKRRKRGLRLHASWSSTGWILAPTSTRHMPCKEEPQTCTCPLSFRYLAFTGNANQPHLALTCNDQDDLFSVVSYVPVAVVVPTAEVKL